MRWTKDNSTSIPRVSFNDDKAELVIESTEAGDAGLYECVGTIEGRLVKSATMVHVQGKQMEENFKYFYPPSQSQLQFLPFGEGRVNLVCS